MSDDIDRLLSLATSTGPEYLNKAKGHTEEFNDFIRDMDFHVDYNSKVHFRYIYWIYLKWRMNRIRGNDAPDILSMMDKEAMLTVNKFERNALHRSRFGALMRSLYPVAANNRKMFYIQNDERFKLNRKERYIIRLLARQYTWRRKHNAKLKEYAIRQGKYYRKKSNPKVVIKTPEYRQWLNLVKKYGKETLPNFQHFRKIYTPELSKNISTWITLIALLKKRRNGLINS